MEDFPKINNNSYHNKNSVGRFSEIFWLFPAQRAEIWLKIQNSVWNNRSAGEQCRN